MRAPINPVAQMKFGGFEREPGSPRAGMGAGTLGCLLWSILVLRHPFQVLPSHPPFRFHCQNSAGSVALSSV